MESESCVGIENEEFTKIFQFVVTRLADRCSYAEIWITLGSPILSSRVGAVVAIANLLSYTSIRTFVMATTWARYRHEVISAKCLRYATI